MRRDREAEAHVHPGGVRADRQIHELLEPSERDNPVELLADVRALQPEDRPVEEDVLAPGEVGMESRAELEQRSDAAADLRRPRCRLDDPREDPEQRALAGAVSPDEPDRARARARAP